MAPLFHLCNCKSPARHISFHQLASLIFPTQLCSLCFSSPDTCPGFIMLLPLPLPFSSLQGYRFIHLSFLPTYKSASFVPVAGDAYKSLRFLWVLSIFLSIQPVTLGMCLTTYIAFNCLLKVIASGLEVALACNFLIDC